MGPTLLHLIVCDDVQVDPQNLLRIDIQGLLLNIRSTATPPFPILRPRFCVFPVFTGYQGTGDLSLQIVRESDKQIIFQTRRRPVRFVGDPENAIGIRFYIHDCVFERAGVYWVECIFSGAIIGRQRLRVLA